MAKVEMALTLEGLTLAIMAVILMVQVASMITLRKTAANYRTALELISDTLRIQAESQHLLIQRVTELERRVNAAELPSIVGGR